MIITSECEQCTQSIINDEDKAKVTIYCRAKEKTYYFGQCIPCDYKKQDYKKRKERKN